MSSSSVQIRKKIQNKFKIRGYTLKLDALNEILLFVNSFPGSEDEALDLFLDQIGCLSFESSVIDKERCRVVTTKLEAGDDASVDIALRPDVIDVFSLPKFRYDPLKKQFYRCIGDWPIHGDASSKAALYKDRFLLLYQRLSRHPHFSKPAFESTMSTNASCEIAPIHSLVAQTGRKWVMGLISQLEDGHFYLEDLTASVEIDLSQAKITTGFLSENTIVVAEGEMRLKGIFQVTTCGFPPLEDREMSLKFVAGHDLFGGGSLTREERLRVTELEKRAVNHMFVILSDIWLDNEEVMGKLETVLSGFESQEVVPSLFVFMGNFGSHPCNLSFSSFSCIKSQFGKLGQMIAAHPRLKEHSEFLFIPGPEDAGPSSALPRCPLPKYLTEELQKRIPNAIFSSNPCRIKLYTQEIVFFRHDLLYKMRRLCLKPPSTEETDDPFEHLVATITHQSHLCPMPLTVQPIIWNYDHCLHLYPAPHSIVLGDKSEQKAFKYGGITCLNPGSFSNDSTFVVYRPCTHEVELSSL